MTLVTTLTLLSLLAQTAPSTAAPTADAPAATEAAPAPAPSPPKASAAPAAPSEPAIVDHSDFGVRLVAELAGGLMGAAVLGFGTQLVVAPMVCVPNMTTPCNTLPYVWGGALVGVAAGTFIGGRMAGGQSAWWSPILGAGAGFAVGYLVAVAGAQLPALAGPAGSMAFILPIAGAILASEWSHREVVKRSAVVPVAVAPVVGREYRGVAVAWVL